jgi:hypothetical protein
MFGLVNSGFMLQKVRMQALAVHYEEQWPCLLRGYMLGFGKSRLERHGNTRQHIAAGCAQRRETLSVSDYPMCCAWAFETRILSKAMALKLYTRKQSLAIDIQGLVEQALILPCLKGETFQTSPNSNDVLLGLLQLNTMENRSPQRSP